MLVSRSPADALQNVAFRIWRNVTAANRAANGSNVSAVLFNILGSLRRMVSYWINGTAFLSKMMMTMAYKRSLFLRQACNEPSRTLPVHESEAFYPR